MVYIHDTHSVEKQHKNIYEYLCTGINVIVLMSLLHLWKMSVQNNEFKKGYSKRNDKNSWVVNIKI